MTTPDEIKSIVRDKYEDIAKKQDAAGCGCGSASVEVQIMADSYSGLDGYVPEADLGLGCGIPTEIAGIRQGDTVLDLGSGAGNDVFVARRSVGPSGWVIGVDMTAAMIERANANNQKLGFTNVEFRLGEIEQLPIDSNSVDVVLSNCVLNLVPDKEKAFAEIARVLKPGGHFSISDIVLSGELPQPMLHAAEMIAGCVATAIQQDRYLDAIAKAGFSSVEIRKEKTIDLPDDVLKEYLDGEGIARYRSSGATIKSITVSGNK